MPLRARSITKRKRRTHWENEERTQLWVTIGFIGVVLFAAVILGAAVALRYYDEHFKAIAKVEGAEITRDQWQTRQKVESFRLDQQEAHVREQLSAGTIDNTKANAQINSIEQKKQSLSSTALENLIDQTLRSKIAPKVGVSVTPAEIDAALAKDATRPEARHVFAIFVEPQLDSGAAQPTAKQKTAARDRAQKALAELKAGKSFADVAKTYSTDGSKENGGDFGYLTSDDTTDKSWVDALFKLKESATTDIIEGADGTFRIGRVDQIFPAVVDSTYPQKVDKAVGLAPYRDALLGDQLETKLRGYITNQAVAGNVEQVHAYEILVSVTKGPQGEPNTGPEARVSHILYSPKNDPQGAGQLNASDPAWAAAEKEATTAATKLRAITQVAAREKEFATIARNDSDDEGSAPSGGDIGFFGRPVVAAEFGTAVFEGTHKKGDIIGPVKTQYGYHVIMYVEQRPSPDKRIDEIVKLVKQPNADFQAIARQRSDGANKATGGDIGWVARYQLEKDVEDALFRLQAGQVSDAILRDDGYHVYKVQERTHRPVDASQRATIEANAFTNWYQPQKDAANVYRDPSVADTGS